MAETPPPHALGLIYCTRDLLVSQDRQLFVTHSTVFIWRKTIMVSQERKTKELTCLGKCSRGLMHAFFSALNLSWSVSGPWFSEFGSKTCFFPTVARYRTGYRVPECTYILCTADFWVLKFCSADGWGGGGREGYYEVANPPESWLSGRELHENLQNNPGIFCLQARVYYLIIPLLPTPNVLHNTLTCRSCRIVTVSHCHVTM